MTTIRFQVCCRQYACGESAVRRSPGSRARSRPADRRRRARSSSSSAASRGRRRRSAASARFSRWTGAASSGRSLERAPEVHVDVARRRPVHPRDLHVAAERDRADAVLDPVPRRLDERRREADVEACAGACRPRDRGEEVAGLVDEDQEREAEDGDEDVHASTCLQRQSRAHASALSRRRRRPRPARPGRAPARRRRAASVSSTTAAMPRNGSRPSRKAATATSFAAL